MTVRAYWSGLMGNSLLRAQAASWRKSVYGIERLDGPIAAGGRILAVFWHGKYLPLFPLLRGRDAVVFTSRSRRGDTIAEICRRFHYRPIQIPDHGREASLERMREALAGASLGAIAVDGPLGPFHVVKRGAVQLASDLGFRLLPIAVASSRHKALVERWDCMEVPRPGSRVVVEIGQPLPVPPGLDESRVDRWCRRLATLLEGLDRRAEARLGHDGTPVA